jgi:5-methylcytosine-specific restriction endonuclease McrA
MNDLEKKIKDLIDSKHSRIEICEILNLYSRKLDEILHKNKWSTRYIEDYLCECGENDKNEFYGKQKRRCKKCHMLITTQRKTELKKKAVEYKGGKCQICDYKKYIGALEFHHLNPEEKDFDPAEALMLKWENAKKEIDKCILVCSNCHKEIHSGLHRGLVERLMTIVC